MRNYVHLLEIILRLRQICVHPSLCKDADLDFRDLQSEDKGPLTKAKALHLLSLLKDSGEDKCTSCDLTMEGLGDGEKALFLAKCGHMFLQRMFGDYEFKLSFIVMPQLRPCFRK
ncbi:hypothetical protein BC829DRAFT_467656 [Chytridium lagenaria]|nr:hypothetical protein BC829DRAFT_467656 [Chytridium lagenaria]